MKSITLFVFSILCLSVYGQQIEWSKSISKGMQKGHFFNDNLYLIGATPGSIIIDSVNYGGSSNETKECIVSFESNGNVNEVLTLSSFVPIDFIKEDNTYYTCGWGPFMFCTSKNEVNGNTSWSNCYDNVAPYGGEAGRYPFNEAISLVKHSNSLYVVGHYEDSISFGTQGLYGSNSLLANVNPSSGIVNWARNVPGTVTKIVDLYNETLLMGHNVSSSPVLFDSITVQLNSSGVILSKTDTAGNFISANVIAQGAKMNDMVVDENKNMFIVGSFYDSCKIGNMPYIGTNGGSFFLKADSIGNILWAKTFFEPNQNMNGTGLYSLSLSPDTSVYISGGFQSDSLNFQDTTIIRVGPNSNDFLSKYSSDGEFQFVKSLHTITGHFNRNEVVVDNQGNVYWWGHFSGQMEIENNIYQSTPYTYSTYLIKLNNNNIPLLIENEEKRVLSIYPNPSFGEFTINMDKPQSAQICVYDVFGKCILIRNCQKDVHHKVDLSSQPKGIYFLEIVSEGEKSVNKIVLQ